MFGGIIKRVLKKIIIAIVGLLLLAVIFFIYFNLPVSIPEKEYDIGITFSYKYSKDIGLDWKENFTAILDDLKIKNIRIPAYWSLIEKEEGVYDFSDLDWQIEEARKRNAKVTLVVGQKVPRWPECYIPEWIGDNSDKRKKFLKIFISETVNRYKNNSAIARWQVENEPFLPFGICPPLDTKLLDEEVSVVRNIDSSRPVMLTDSGELSIWIPAAKRGDVFGTTMYFTVYTKKFGYFEYPIGPNFFKFKRWLIRTFAKQNNAIIVELQGEPWIDEWTVNAPLEKQLKSMNAKKLRENVEFAKKTGFPEIYLWGAEWWYWVKINHNNSDIWDTAREIYAK